MNPLLLSSSAFVGSAVASIAFRNQGWGRRLLQQSFFSTSTSDVSTPPLSISDVMSLLEERIQRDEGGRGIGPLIVRENNELWSAARAILAAENNIAIITGFPCMLDYTPPTETDGPLGALAIARACLAVGKAVRLITDECNENVLLGCAAAADLNERFKSSKHRVKILNTIQGDSEDNSGEQYGSPSIILESFPGSKAYDLTDDMRLFELSQSTDLVVAIERAGPAHDKTYRTMRKRNMTDIVAPLERLITGEFEVLEEINQELPEGSKMLPKRTRSIGIGDGGNEVGMGKVFDKIVASSIPNAADIACVTAADHLLVSSVSNWGGYALAAAVAAVAFEEGDSKYFSTIEDAIDACLPSFADEVKICQRMIDCGARDGISGKNDLYVDGMPLKTSLDVLEDLRRTALRLR